MGVSANTPGGNHFATQECVKPHCRSQTYTVFPVHDISTHLEKYKLKKKKPKNQEQSTQLWGLGVTVILIRRFRSHWRTLLALRGSRWVECASYISGC